MKKLVIALSVVLMGCSDKPPQETTTGTVVTTEDSVVQSPPQSLPQDTTAAGREDSQVTQPDVSSKVYGNKRFKDVTVKRVGGDKFLIEGKGQIFEASFSWVIEDGHEELMAGHEMTDAGAPEWGKFSFTVEAPKKRPNSTLHLVLYEASAKDGSRQHELPILLY
jgi:hypothetical protein